MTVKVWVLVCAESITRRLYLVPLEAQNTQSFLRALEILQARRGKLSVMYVDQHASHATLNTDPPLDTPPQKSIFPTLAQALREGQSQLLQESGLQIIIGAGNRHSHVGICENLIYSVKQTIMHLFVGKPTIFGLFDLSHRLSLIESFLNDRPTFAINNQISTPNVFEVANLRFSQTVGPNIISHLAVPKGQEIQTSLYLMSQESKKMLTTIASNLSERVLNFANLTSQHLPSVGQWVLIPDKIIYKNIGSFATSVGRVIKIKNRTIYIKLANNRVINRALSDIIPCAANKHHQISLDILDLPIFDDKKDEQFKEIKSQFEVFLPTITLNEQTGKCNDTVQHPVDTPRTRLTDDIQIDPTYQPVTEDKEEELQLQLPDQLGPRRSARRHKPSWRYKERYTEDTEDTEAPP